MTERIAESSPRFKARLAGVLYLFTGASAFNVIFVGGRLIVRDDAAATAHNILASESLFRLGFAADLVGIAAYVGVTAILYVLLKPVNRTLSLLAAFFGLAGCTIWAVALVCRIAPLIFLGRAPYLTAFATVQLQALAYMSLRLHGYGTNIAMVFFGFYCFLIGCLIVGSTFIPRIVGVLMAMGGLGYLTYTFAFFLSPGLAAQLYTYSFLAGGIGEGSLVLWLVAIGVNAAKWKEQATASGA